LLTPSFLQRSRKETWWCGWVLIPDAECTMQGGTNSVRESEER
jgi:hypothetical protein